MKESLIEVLRPAFRSLAHRDMSNAGHHNHNKVKWSASSLAVARVAYMDEIIDENEMTMLMNPTAFADNRHSLADDPEYSLVFLSLSEEWSIPMLRDEWPAPWCRG